ncbi:uncharacterized protein LOC128647867 [Bombina bombina]|uniref:uncharacterized protein LOC128647867 n=1 Tax=Bombina bombina TaxID=8345 RepID=UPI00235B0B2A|nr:uncharacterized protein LOC128647867 [Bombina bombina]
MTTLIQSVSRNVVNSEPQPNIISSAIPTFTTGPTDFTTERSSSQVSTQVKLQTSNGYKMTTSISVTSSSYINRITQPITNSTTSSTPSDKLNILKWFAMVGSLLVILICVLVLLLYRRHTCKKNKRQETSQATFLKKSECLDVWCSSQAMPKPPAVQILSMGEIKKEALYSEIDQLQLSTNKPALVSTHIYIPAVSMLDALQKQNEPLYSEISPAVLPTNRSALPSELRNPKGDATHASHPETSIDSLYSTVKAIDPHSLAPVYSTHIKKKPAKKNQSPAPPYSSLGTSS